MYLGVKFILLFQQRMIVLGRSSTGFWVSVKREMQNLSAKIGVQIKPVFQSRKISQVFSPKENKPPIVNNQCMVYKFQCDLCDTDYVGYTTRHLHQPTGEHNYSAIGRPWPIKVQFEGQTILCFEKMYNKV